MTDAKKPDPQQIEALEKELDLGHEAARIRLDADLLTPRDMLRARAVLGGRNPFEVLADPIEAMILIAWCLVSRTDPSFTWEQAETTPFSRFDMTGDEPPPPAGPPASNGTRPAKRSASTPRK